MTLLYLGAPQNIFPAAVSNPPLFSNLQEDQEWLIYLFKGNKRKSHVRAQSLAVSAFSIRQMAQFPPVSLEADAAQI